MLASFVSKQLMSIGCGSMCRDGFIGTLEAPIKLHHLFKIDFHLNRVFGAGGFRRLSLYAAYS